MADNKQNTDADAQNTDTDAQNTDTDAQNTDTDAQNTDTNATASTAAERKHTVAPITVTHPENVSLASLRLFRDPPWTLRLTIDKDRSYVRVKVVRAAPLSYPERYISLLDAKDEEICMIDDLSQVNEETRTLVMEELDRRYLTSIIQRVRAVRNEFGTSYWEVDTHRGAREFVVQNAAENAHWLGDHRLLLTDVDGNRFEVPRVDKLDKRSIAFVEQVL